MPGKPIKKPSPPKKEEPKPKVAPPKPSEPAKKPGDSYDSLDRASIGKRFSDCFFILTYLAWFFVAFILFFARCRFLLPATLNELEFAGPVCEALERIEGPLRPFVESQQEWGKKVFSEQSDFTLELVNLANFLFLAPVALLLALGFLAGYNWVKNVALVHSAVMLYNMVAVDIYAYEVLLKSDPLNVESAAFWGFIVYGYATAFPLVVVKRVWGDAPFSLKAISVRRGFFMRAISFLSKAVLLFWMVAASTGLYEFSVKHTASMRHMPSVVDSGKEGWNKAGPYREQLLVHAGEFQVYAGQKVIDWAAQGKELMVDLGEKVLAWAQSSTSSEGPTAGSAEKAASPKKDTPPPKPPKKDPPKKETPPPRKEAPPPPKKETPPPKQATPPPPPPTPPPPTPAPPVEQKEDSPPPPPPPPVHEAPPAEAARSAEGEGAKRDEL